MQRPGFRPQEYSPCPRHPSPRPSSLTAIPGRSSQTIGIARELGTEIDLIHEPSVGVIGNKGDSQCYIGVQRKVEAIHEAFGQDRPRRWPDGHALGAAGIHRRHLRRHSQWHARNALLPDRAGESPKTALSEHLSGSGLAGAVAVVACDKPPVGTLAALLEHNSPPSSCRTAPSTRAKIRNSNEPLDIVSAYQVAGHADDEIHASNRLHCLPRLWLMRRHVHLQHHADLYRRGRHAAAEHGGPALRRSPPDGGIPASELVGYLQA